ncbi:MAG TPA: AAA family ATPase [Actinocrinis sp.]|nr:AAA family ATPase [Actinocrinis sp.]
MSTVVDDPVIRAESAHLAQSRAALRKMREDTLGLKAQGATAVATEILEASLQARAAALIDHPDVPLFFGRLDYAQAGADVAGPADAPGEYAGEQYYIGRRHVHDAVGDPLVIDWRAPVSLPFYRASPKATFGLGLRRRFGFAGGTLTAFEDEVFDGRALGPSRILTEEIERPRVGPMRDIVATIQPEQDEIVRAGLGDSVCVQGAPGTGKTAVGLHRVAYLLYAHRERLKRGGALVVGPNREFLKYIEQVLPALGEVEVAQATVEELVARVPVRGVDAAEPARIKGDARMAEVLSRAVWAHLGRPEEGVVVPRGSRIWRVSAYEIAAHIDGIRSRGVRYSAGRAMLAQRIAHTVLTRMEAAGESPDDRVQNAVARLPVVRKTVDRLWPAVDPVKLLFALYSSPERLAAASDGLLDPAEQAVLGWPGKPPRSVAATQWTLADAVLLDELADQLDRVASLAHVVLDEAQDLSSMQCRAVGRRCATGSVTVLGDIAQATTPWAVGSWPETLRHLGKPEVVIEELTLGFRVPREVIEFAARLLPVAAPELAAPTSVRQTEDSLSIVPVGARAGTAGNAANGAAGEAAGDAAGELVAEAADMAAGAKRAVLAAAVDAARRALSDEGSVGLIVADLAVPVYAAALTAAGLDYRLLGAPEPDTTRDQRGTQAQAQAQTPAQHQDQAQDPDQPQDPDPAQNPDRVQDPDRAEARLVLVPASLAKGLEYDRVIVAEPAEIVAAEYSELLGLRRLYVVLTRAVSHLTVLHAEPLPALLAGV